MLDGRRIVAHARNGDRGSVDTITAMLRLSGGELAPVAKVLGVTYQDLAELWRTSVEIDRVITEIRGGATSTPGGETGNDG